MVIGSCARAEDIELNVCKKKHLTNTRSSSADEALTLVPPKVLSLEQALDFINVDELLEVTPESLRIRKRILDPTLRKRANMKNNHFILMNHKKMIRTVIVTDHLFVLCWQAHLENIAYIVFTALFPSLHHKMPGCSFRFSLLYTLHDPPQRSLLYCSFHLSDTPQCRYSMPDTALHRQSDKVF